MLLNILLALHWWNESTYEKKQFAPCTHTLETVSHLINAFIGFNAFGTECHMPLFYIQLSQESLSQVNLQQFPNPFTEGSPSTGVNSLLGVKKQNLAIKNTSSTRLVRKSWDFYCLRQLQLEILKPNSFSIIFLFISY